MIYNNTTDSVYIALLETRASVKSKWLPCSTPAKCNRRGILPAKTTRVEYARIYGWYPGASVNLYWWHLINSPATPSGYTLDGGPHMRTINTPHIVTRRHYKNLMPGAG